MQLFGRQETWNRWHGIEDVRNETGDVWQEMGDRKRETGDVRHEMWDRRRETWDRSQEMQDRRWKTGYVRRETWDMRQKTWDTRVRQDTWDKIRETRDVGHETGDRRCETWDVRQVDFVLNSQQCWYHTPMGGGGLASFALIQNKVKLLKNEHQVFAYLKTTQGKAPQSSIWVNFCKLYKQAVSENMLWDSFR